MDHAWNTPKLEDEYPFNNVTTIAYKYTGIDDVKL